MQSTRHRINIMQQIAKGEFIRRPRQTRDIRPPLGRLRQRTDRSFLSHYSKALLAFGAVVVVAVAVGLFP